MGLLDHMVVPFLSFYSTLLPLSIAAASFWVPINSILVFQLLHILANTCLVCFFFNIILTDMMWYLVVVLICISQIISDADHLSMCLLAIFMFSLRKSLFESFSPFLNWVIRVYLLLNCGVLCIFWKLTPYQIHGFASVFSHFVGCLFLCWLFTRSAGVFSWTSSY